MSSPEEVGMSSGWAARRPTMQILARGAGRVVVKVRQRGKRRGWAREGRRDGRRQRMVVWGLVLNR